MLFGHAARGLACRPKAKSLDVEESIDGQPSSKHRDALRTLKMESPAEFAQKLNAAKTLASRGLCDGCARNLPCESFASKLFILHLRCGCVLSRVPRVSRVLNRYRGIPAFCVFKLRFGAVCWQVPHVSCVSELRFELGFETLRSAEGEVIGPEVYAVRSEGVKSKEV